jgi:hypothetical protein
MRCVFMCAVLAGCGTIPRYAKFASGVVAMCVGAGRGGGALFERA